MKIAIKWKIFALNHHLSDYEGDGVALFDALVSEDDRGGVFERHDVTAWYPFQYMDSDNPEEFADSIIAMARRAQELELEEVCE